MLGGKKGGISPPPDQRGGSPNLAATRPTMGRWAGRQIQCDGGGKNNLRRRSVTLFDFPAGHRRKKDLPANHIGFAALSPPETAEGLLSTKLGNAINGKRNFFSREEEISPLREGQAEGTQQQEESPNCNRHDVV